MVCFKPHRARRSLDERRALNLELQKRGKLTSHQRGQSPFSQALDSGFEVFIRRDLAGPFAEVEGI